VWLAGEIGGVGVVRGGDGLDVGFGVWWSVAGAGVDEWVYLFALGGLDLGES
jgi:hypothetical protein